MSDSELASAASRPQLADQWKRTVRLLVIYVLPWFVFVPYVPISKYPFSLDDLIPLSIAVAGLGARAFGGRPRFEAVTATLVGLAVVSLAASVFARGGDAEVVRSAARGFGRTLVHVALMVTITSSLRSSRDVRRMLIVIVAAASAQSLFSLWAYATDYIGPAGIGVAPTPTYSTLKRVHGTFAHGTSWAGGTPVNSNFLAAYLMCAAVLAIGLALETKRWRVKLLWVMAAGLCASGIGVSFTRASFAGLGAGLLVLAVLSRRYAFVIGTIVIAAAAIDAAPRLGERLLSLENNRLALYSAALRIAEDHPFAGVGNGNYLNVLKSSSRYQYTPFGEAGSTPHNSVLLAACQSGWLAGLLLAAAVALGLVRMAFLSIWLQNRRRRVLAAALAAAGAAFALQDQVNNLLLVPKTATFFWTFVALALVVERSAHRDALSVAPTAARPPSAVQATADDVEHRDVDRRLGQVDDREPDQTAKG